MNQLSNSTYEIAQVCLLAGKIMLENGGETYRVEDTMTRVADAFGVRHAHSFVTPTGIIFSIDGPEQTTRLIRISERSTDLRKVTVVNAISRKISQGELSVTEAYRLLEEIDGANPGYPLWFKIAAAAVASACFLIMFGGAWGDFIPTFLCGGAGFSFLVYFHRWVPIKFFAEFLASLIIGSTAYLFLRTGFGHDLDNMIIGSVMPLVPGLLITNAVRDLMAGHFVSGVSKGAEAFLTAFAIGAGIAFVLSFYSGEGIG
ncbi:threonine/serine exporter family protein [Paenibacillus validus]|uniref:Threonine/serine exporter n=1 Tax=Paenibacillus validus TaxID=44253 RepID=A0A7X2ZBR1_9BACL|nr:MULTISPECIES: threonine/serine exporter family protein [Paenibacillus]MED4599419.1 threonine/serine exporter family protein [Paenibacillus validus]MED4605131.1 threonine/serine exporter family protein [Paenibacillus validus]MUG72014.1 threonine/serine exporter [Paenibacillus validus]